MKTNPNDSAFVPITGYEGLYKIDSFGNVISIRKNLIMKPTTNKRSGYLYIGLTDHNGKQKGHRLHRLVAMEFIPNPNNLPEVNHEDFDKQNNHYSNLKWCDRFYQNQHASKKPNRKWQQHRLGKVGKENPASKAVIVKDLNENEIGRYESGVLAAKATNSNQTKVSSCCLGKRKSHNNLKFQFA